MAKHSFLHKTISPRAYRVHQCILKLSDGKLLYTKPQWCPNIIIYEPLLLGKNTHWNGDETTGGLFKYLISIDSSFYWVIVNLWP